jgi:hypothetical protein
MAETAKKRKIVTRKKKIETPPHDAIAERAYYLALERNGGDAFENWIQAERELVRA